MPSADGIGADGLLIIENTGKADIRMRIVNEDGSEAEMCGNGIRCFEKYVFREGIVPKTEFAVETLAGIMRPKLVMKDGVVTGVTPSTWVSRSWNARKSPSWAKAAASTAR